MGRLRFQGDRAFQDCTADSISLSLEAPQELPCPGRRDRWTQWSPLLFKCMYLPQLTRSLFDFLIRKEGLRCLYFPPVQAPGRTRHSRHPSSLAHTGHEVLLQPGCTASASSLRLTSLLIWHLQALRDKQCQSIEEDGKSPGSGALFAGV